MPASTPTTDIQLWQQLIRGSELALGKLLTKYFNPLQNYGCKFVRNEDFVKDCVQEVFIEIWNRRDHISTPDSVRAYLLSSVRKREIREGYRQRINTFISQYAGAYNGINRSNTVIGHLPGIPFAHRPD